jgi:plasmid stabilization system protein ParE
MQILDACTHLGDNAGLGHTREDLTDRALLFWPVGSYLIIYRADRRPMQVVAVTHGAMNIPAVLRRRGF